MNFILDNLIAESKAKPMIIVMETGDAERPGQGPPAGRAGEGAGRGAKAAGRGGAPAAGRGPGGAQAAFADFFSAFEDVIVKERS